MYCSNCGLKIKEKQIEKALENDSININDINYLAKSLTSVRKFEYRTKILEAKETDKENQNKVKQEAKKEFETQKEVISSKLAANDIQYFKDELKVKNQRDVNTLDYYVCPRCGKLVRPNLDENDIKSLARASHSEIHRGRNNISSGMCSLMIGIILFIIGLMFFALSFKATAGGILVTDCVEFYVFIALVTLGAILIVFGIASFIYGRNKVKRNEALLKDIQNGVFHQ